MSIVTRFAPSPTGYLHVGGARTALFNWLLARQAGGKFILRIEDTDRTRSTEESLRRILEDLTWLGLDWDEGPQVGGPNGPYFQSQRLDIYRRYVDRLLSEGKAYKCFETAEELAAAREAASKAGRGYKYDGAGRRLTDEQVRRYEAEGRPCTVRLATGESAITVEDAILGNVTVPAEELEDFVILKSDGYPTYHLAVVVDDELMGVTHVLRGQEHLMNTPKHIALQNALGFRRPVYAHLPLIFNMDGSKMSKRDKDKAIRKGLPAPEIDVHDFRVAGYLPEALLNFVSLLGWSPGGDKELMSRQEMVQLFSLERIGKTNARFDRDKLRAFNAEYIKSASPQRMVSALRDFLQFHQHPLSAADDQTLARFWALYRERARTLKEMLESGGFFFADRIEYDAKAVRKVLQKEGARQALQAAECELAKLQAWTADAIQSCLEGVCERMGVGMGKVAQPIRVAVSGTTVSPPIGETLEFLGRQKTLQRVGDVIGMLAGRAGPS